MSSSTRSVISAQEVTANAELVNLITSNAALQVIAPSLFNTTPGSTINADSPSTLTRSVLVGQEVGNCQLVNLRTANGYLLTMPDAYFTNVAHVVHEDDSADVIREHGNATYVQLQTSNGALNVYAYQSANLGQTLLPATPASVVKAPPTARWSPASPTSTGRRLAAS